MKPVPQVYEEEGIGLSPLPLCIGALMFLAMIYFMLKHIYG